MAASKKDVIVICFSTVDQKVKDILDKPNITLYDNVIKEDLKNALSTLPVEWDWAKEFIENNAFDKSDF